MRRYHQETFIFLFFVVVLIFTNRSISESMRDYSHLLEFIALEDKEEPLHPFSDFQKEMDMESHLANVDFFQKHQELLERIRHDLSGEDIQYRLEGMERRLLFVPETRHLYAFLYESYCRDVINEVLEKTGLDNPLIRIEPLLNRGPEISESEDGVSAYLVHNLVKEYVAAYVFSGDGSRQVRVEVKGQEFVGEVGSFTTDVILEDDGGLAFTRAPFTIWQNSAKNPYTALMVPVEETLHIALRDITETVIRRQMAKQSVKDVETLREIVDEWIAVEEGVVGGLVNNLLPGILVRLMPGFDTKSLMIQDIEEKSGFQKYRYLKAGVLLARQMGYRQWLGMFQVAPKKVRALLEAYPSLASLPLG